MKLINRTRGTVVAQRVEIASTFASRSKGLLGRSGMPTDSALIIKPCNSIHTFFMRFSIDVLFMNKNGLIVKLYSALPPGRLSPIVWKAAYVIEMAQGALAISNTVEGDILECID